MLHLVLADPAQPDWTNIADATNLVRIIGILIPLITAVITKKFAAARLKSIVTLLLSAITGSVTYLIAADGHHYNWAGFVNAVINAYIPAIATYYGFWKPTLIEPALANATQTVGLGTNALAQGDHMGAQVYDDNVPTVPKNRNNADGGYTTIATIGVVLTLVGAILLILTALNVFNVSIAISVILIVIGLVVWVVGARSSTL